MSSRTAISVADPHEEVARRALLGRLAGDIAVLANAGTMRWTCCWIDYDVRGVGWSWRFCNGNPPGTLSRRPCGHWHHRTEVFLA